MTAEVEGAMAPDPRGAFGNPSTDRLSGLRSHQAVKAAREQIAELAGAHPRTGNTPSIVGLGATDPSRFGPDKGKGDR